jgi:restriction system protein
LAGTLRAGEYGLLVTLGTFSTQARSIASTHNNLRLIDGNALVDLILSHYEQFDPRYKGLLPLKRVYVPDLDEPEE